ncbi:MAG: membrane protein [Nitrospirales bacterium]|nr:MAG: membrane protein [Nitrospirales bacterium]
MSELLEILHPSYVLRNALYGGMLTGLVLPLVGVLMYARRMVFLGVALPQLSTCGIAAAVFWHLTLHQQDPVHSDFLLALIGSTIVTTGTLFLLAMIERNSRSLVEGRIGVVYILAGAITVLLLASERVPEVGITKLLQGQIIAISDSDMVILLASYSLIVMLLCLFRRELLLVSVDRDMALSLGKQMWVWDLVLYGSVGFAISLGVLMVGPLLTFAFLLLPVMTAERMAKRFSAMPIIAALLGVIIAFTGFVVSYFLDWPTSATDALVAYIILAMITVVRWMLTKKTAQA